MVANVDMKDKIIWIYITKLAGYDQSRAQETLCSDAVETRKAKIKEQIDQKGWQTWYFSRGGEQFIEPVLQ